MKAIEYTISGAACVLQNNPVFNSQGWVHRKNCLMAHDAESMMLAALELARDPKLRYELVSAAQEYVHNERNQHSLESEWKAVLQ